MKNQNTIIYTGNALIDTIHHQKFTEVELKIMYWFFTQIKKEDIALYQNRQTKQIIIPASELAQYLDFENDKSFHHLKRLADTIQSKTMTSKSDNNIFRAVIVPTFRYDDGVITLELNHHVLPHLIDLKEKYTIICFQNILKLESSYAIKLYTLLKQYQHIGSRIFTIDSLREYFGIQPNEYTRYTDLKINTIKTAILHINKHTDLFIQFKEIKTSRKITMIEFIIKLKDDLDDISQAEIKQVPRAEINQVTQFFINLATFDKTLAKKIYKFIKVKGEDYVIKSMLYTYTKKPKNLHGYLIKSLENGYGQDIAIGELEHLTYKKFEKLSI